MRRLAVLSLSRSTLKNIPGNEFCPLCAPRRAGHESTVSSVLALSDGRIVSGSWDGRVKVWAEGRDDRPVLEFAHDGKVMAVIAMGQRIVSGSEDRSVRIWSLADGSCEHVLEGHTLPVEYLCATDDLHFASAGPDNTVRKWSVESGCLVRYQKGREHDSRCFTTVRFECPPSQMSGRVSFTMPKGKDFSSVKLAAGARDGTLRLAFTAPPDAAAEEATSGGCGCFGSPPKNGKGSAAGAEQPHSVEAHKPTRLNRTFSAMYIADGAMAVVHSFVMLSDGSIVSTCEGNELRVWHETGGMTHDLRGHSDKIWSLGVTEEDFVVSGSWDGSLIVWDAKAGQIVHELHGHTDKVWGMVIMRDGVVVSASFDKTLRVWDTVDGSCRLELRGHTDKVWSLAQLGHRRVVSGSVDCSLRVWNIESGDCERVLMGHTGCVSAVASIGGGILVSGSWDRTIRVWNGVEGTCTHTMGPGGPQAAGHLGKVTALAAIGNGMVVSGSADNRVIVWDCQTGKCTRQMNDHWGWITTLMPLGNNRVVSGSNDNTLRIFNCETGESEYVLAPQQGNSEVFALASGGDDQSSGKFVFTVEAAQNFVSNVSVVT